MHSQSVLRTFCAVSSKWMMIDNDDYGSDKNRNDGRDEDRLASDNGWLSSFFDAASDRVHSQCAML